MNRLVSMFALGAVACAGCQGARIASRDAVAPLHPVAAERPQAQPAAPPEALANPVAVQSVPVAKRAAPKVEGKVRLVSGVEGEPESAAPLPIPALPTLSLDEAIERGLGDNPDMIAVRQAEGVSAAAYGVAETYPFNPFVQTRVLPYQHGTEPGITTPFRYVLLMQNV